MIRLQIPEMFRPLQSSKHFPCNFGSVFNRSGKVTRPCPSRCAVNMLASLYDVVFSVASLAALYAAWRVGSRVYSQRIIDVALANQKLHSPPSTIPLLGNTLDALFLQKTRFWDWIAEQSELSGGKPWVLRLVGRPTTLVCTSPEALEDIFKTHFDTFERGADLRDLLYDFFGDGIVGADGENWQKQRRAASHDESAA